MAMIEWTAYRFIIAFTMLTMGSLNTFFGKWADRTEAYGTPGYPKRTFQHPFFQAICMFTGEMMCGVLFIIILIVRYHKGQSPREALGKMTFSLKEIFTEKGAFAKSFFVFFPPAMCDCAATSLMYIALNYTTAASYQMLRGSVIIFTALLSVAFLERVIPCQKWVGIFCVIAGLLTVGMSDFLFNPANKDINAVITGDELVVMAQIIASTQMTYEEAFVRKLDVNPLLCVGLEGFFGFVVLSLLSIVFYFIPVGSMFTLSPENRLEDMLDAFAMFRSEWQVWLPICGLVCSIAFFNWAGVAVTKELSATTRMVIDSCRTLIIWSVSLGLRWQKFNPLQIVGFCIQTTGIFIYNEFLTPELVKDVATCHWCRKRDVQSSDKPVSVQTPAEKVELKNNLPVAVIGQQASSSLLSASCAIWKME